MDAFFEKALNTNQTRLSDFFTRRAALTIPLIQEIGQTGEKRQRTQVIEPQGRRLLSKNRVRL
jgi:hypothetical protein